MDPMNPQKSEVANHEAGHAVMGLIYGLKIKKSSLMGTAEYRGVTSFEPFERQDTFEHAEREIRLNLAGFVGEGLFSDNKIKIEPPHHPELTDSIKIFRDLQNDVRYRNFASGLPDIYPRANTMIVDPAVRIYINHMLHTCFAKMIPLKQAVKATADELYRKGELTGEEVVTIFNSSMLSSQGPNQTFGNDSRSEVICGTNGLSTVE